MNYWQDQYAEMALKNDELLKKNLELEEKLAVAERAAMQNGCDRNKAEFKLAIAREALERIAGEYYCRETGRYIDDAKEALEKIKG